MNLQKRVHILGVPIDPVTSLQAVDTLRSMLLSQKQHHVMTPNSEMLVEAHRNPDFRSLLQRTALNLPDSAGLLFAASKTKQYLPERVTGVDTVTRLCSTLREGERVFLLGGGPGVAQKAAKHLHECNPHLMVVGTYGGSPSREEADHIVSMINRVQPKLLLVAYGAPKQDLWIDEHLRHMPSVRVAMGIGGTLDFLAGTQKRAPVLLQALHLEWLWRLCVQPRRIGRIWRAVVIFPLLVAKEDVKNVKK